MNAQTLKRLAVALVALIVVWLGISLLRRAGRDREGRLALPRFDPKTVDQALIVRGADTLRFVRRADGWAVNGHRANATAVGDMLSALADTAAQSELVAENASSHQRLGLDSATARRVTISQGGKTVLRLLLGSQSYGSLYVRKPGDNAAYLFRGSLTEVAGRQPDDWRDKTIARVEPESVTAVAVQRGKRAYSLKREVRRWSLGSTAADSAAVARLLGQFQDLQAAGFPTEAQAESARFNRPARVVQLAASGGKPLLVLRMDSTAGGFWVRRDGDSTTYRLDAWTVGQLAPADSTLRKR